MAIIALLIAVGGKLLLVTLGEHRLWGAVIGVGLVVVAARALRSAYDPTAPEGRVDVTRAGAYFCAALLALWAILAPARWVFGSCIVAAEIAVVFDLITVVARGRVAGGN